MRVLMGPVVLESISSVNRSPQQHVRRHVWGVGTNFAGPTTYPATPGDPPWRKRDGAVGQASLKRCQTREKALPNGQHLLCAA